MALLRPLESGMATVEMREPYLPNIQFVLQIARSVRSVLYEQCSLVVA